MDLTSDDFSPDGLIPERHSRPGGNVAPVLRWGDVPEDTVELVLTCIDPDAPRGDFVHWIAAGISPERTVLDDEAAALRTVPGRNGFGEDGYGGPEPPPGDDPHRYVFRLHALDHTSGLEPGATIEEAQMAIEAGTLATAELVGRFGR